MAEAAAAAATETKPAETTTETKPSLVTETKPAETTTTEAKSGETKPSLVTEKPKEGDKPAEGATFDPKGFKAPDGFTIDEKLMTSYSEIVNDTKLSTQERGNKLLGLYADAVKSVGEANTKAWTDMQTQWQTEVKADKDIGGANWEATRLGIAKMIDSLGSERSVAFKQALDITGAGNNPAIVYGLHILAKALTEGGHVTGNTPRDAKSLKEVFYPNSPDMK